LKKTNLVVTSIVFLRIISALSIYYFHLWGFVFYQFVDYWDAHFIINIAKTKWDYYQKLDKRLDVFGFITMMVVGSGYGYLNIFLYLLAFRLLGQMLYEMSKKQQILIVFPNLIEIYYIWIILFQSNNYYILLLLIFVKILQEFFLHFCWPNYLKRNGYPWFIRVFGVKNEINWD